MHTCILLLNVIMFNLILILVILHGILNVSPFDYTSLWLVGSLGYRKPV